MALTLNKIIHFDSQGLEELDSATAVTNIAWADDGNDQRGLRFGVNAAAHAGAFNEVSSAGNGYMLHCRVRWLSGTTGTRSLSVTTSSGTAIAQISFTNSLIQLLDDGGSFAAALSPGTSWSGYLELYFENSATGAFTIKFYDDDGTLVDSASGTDSFTGTIDWVLFIGNSVGDLIIEAKNVLFWSGAASASDLKGPCGVHAGRNYLASATPDSGTVADAGLWAQASTLPFSDGSDVQYTGGVASGHVYTNDFLATNGRGPYLHWDDGNPVGTYHFDASDDGPTDTSGAWTNDANAFDGNAATSASAGSLIGSLGGGGTNAPASGDAFVAMGLEAVALKDGGGILSSNIFGDGGTPTYESRTSNWEEDVWTPVNASGLSYSDIQALEIVWNWNGGVSNTAYAYRAQVRLYPQYDYSAGILGANYIFRMKRGNGGGTAHYAVYGNNVDTPTTTADLALDSAYNEYFFVSESATVVPTSGQYLAYGMAKDGGARDLIMSAALGAVAFVKTFPTAALFPYHLRRIKRDDMQTMINL